MKNGLVFLFYNKSQERAPNASAKHNALYDYMNSEANKSKGLRGGVIFEHGENWKYSPMKLDNTSEITHWEAFYPEQYADKI